MNKQAYRLMHLGVAIAALFGGVTMVGAQITADPNSTHRPTIDQSANGRTVVQIVTPNSAGVSHNKYSQFNVDRNGVILNNASGLTQTQLAGFVNGNPMLNNGSARMIINEVTGASRSQLNGFIEVAGQRAEVIVANPNGISCSGCGFINTSRGVLTTGTPEFAADGNLSGLRVTRGDINIDSTGLNAANTDQFDLIARSVQINGELWGNRLNVVTGANLVNYTDLGAQVIQGEGPQPTVGIDLALMGGMYANRIRLIGTEGGVGVRGLGNIAAQAGDISIDSAGKVTLNGSTTATGQIAISSDDNVDNAGMLYAQQTVQINSAKQITNSGTIAAQADLTLDAHGISSTGNLAAGADASGNAAQSGSLTLTAAGNITATGQNVAGGNISMTGAAIDVAHAKTSAVGRIALTAAAGDIDNTGGDLSADSVAVHAAGIIGNTDGSIEANGATGTLMLAGSSVDNSGGRIANIGNGLTQIDGGAQITNTNAGNVADRGTIGGNGDVVLNSRSLNNSQGGRIIASHDLTLTQDGLVNNNAGSLYAANEFNYRQSNGAVSNIAGNIGSDRNLTLNVASITGAGQIVAGQDASISLQGDYINMAGGTLAANRDLMLSVGGTFTNLGALNSVRDLTLNAGAVDNEGSGLINADNGTTAVHAGSIRNVGRIYGSDVALGAQVLNNDVDTATNVAGVIASRNSLNIGAMQITNREHGLIQSLGDMIIGGALDTANQAIGTADSLNNSSATIDAGGKLTMRTAALTNSNAHFTTELQDDPTRTTHVTEYAYWAAPDLWFTADQVSWSDSGDGGIVLVIPDGNRFEKFYKRDYTEVVQRTVVLSSDPGKISSGGDMTLSGAVTNDKSIIVAGGTLGGTVGAINNVGATGQETTIDHMTAGENYYHWVDGHPHQNHYTYDQGGAAYDNVLASTTVDLPVFSVQQNTNPASGPNQALGAQSGSHGIPGAAGGLLNGGSGSPGNTQTIGIPSSSLPNNSLFTLHPQPGQNYLVETDPQFTNSQTFLSSDYMLGRMSLDPQKVQQRLGDGFYEQTVINNQITQLTGKATLGGYATAEDEYKALMDAGVATAQQFQLTPGMALTDAQMAALTSDIVWLVKQDVTLPDGSHATVLAPVVYLSHTSDEDISPTGSLISGKDIDLLVNGTMANGGTLQASNNTIVQATDIKNTGDIRGTGATGSTTLTASNDVISSGGSISGHGVGILAGRDVTLETTTASNMATDGLNKVIDQVGSVKADQLTVQAGRDVNLAAAGIDTTGNASINAGNNLNLTAVNTQDSYNISYDSRNHLNESSTQVIGTGMTADGDLSLKAGQDINIAAAQAITDGKLSVVAGHDVNIGSAEQTASLDQAIYTTSKGLFSSSTSQSTDIKVSNTAVGSSLSGNSVEIQAGNDAGIIGSSVTSTKDTTIAAGGNLTIAAATSTEVESRTWEEHTSGITGGSGLSLHIGSSSDKGRYEGTTVSEGQNRSVVGSANGDVTLTAGKDAAIIGSDVIAGQAADGTGGDISVTAQNINIVPGVDAAQSAESHEMRESGIGVTLAGTAYDTVKNLQGIGQSGGSKTQKVDAAGKEIGASGGSMPQLAVSIGNSSSNGQSSISSLSNQGSSLTAAGNLKLSATGTGAKDANGKALDGDINVSGSNLAAGAAAILQAARDVNIVAATDHVAQDSSASNSSNSLNLGAEDLGTLGRSFNGGPNQGGVTMSPIGISHGADNGQTSASTQVASTVSADHITVVSGSGDINVIGSSVAAENNVTLLAQQGQININSGLNEQTHHEDHNGEQIGSLGSSNNGASSTVGYRSTSDTLDAAQQLENPVRSQITSNSGDVSLNAKQDLNIKGSDISAGQDLNLVGQNVNIDAGTDASQSRETYESHQVGITASVGGIAGQVAQTVNQAEDAQANGDDKLAALYAAKAAVIAGNAEKGITTDGTSSPQLVKVTVAIGTNNSESQSQSSTSQQQGSTLAGGGDVTIIATGSGAQDSAGKASDGDINMVGTQVSGKNVDLAAAHDINLVSATDTTGNNSSNSSSGASIGVGFALGGDQNGFTLELGANKVDGTANSDSVTHDNTHITASDTLSITSGRDANLIGAQVRGDTVTADVGRNLNVQSQQDTDVYHSQQNSSSAGVSLCIPPFCYGSTVSAQGSMDSGNIDSTFKSVAEQSGIYAGQGGYGISVGGNTDLVGAVIASAADKSKNNLSTGTLTTSDLQNVAQYSASNSSISGSANLGASTSPQDLLNGKENQGMGLGQNAVNNAISNMAGNSQNPLEGNASGVTKSAISDGNIAITDTAGQQAKTGETAAETVAGLDHDTDNANQSIDKIFNLKDIQQQQQIAQATSDLAQQIAPDLYKEVGDYLHDTGANTPEKVAVHALIGGLMTKAMGGDFGTGAAGAAAATLAVQLFGQEIEKQDGISQQDKDALVELMGMTVANITAQLAGGSIADANAAGVNAKLATEFNYLKHEQRKAKNAATADCLTSGKNCGTAQALEAQDAASNKAIEQLIATCDGESCDKVATFIKNELESLGCSAPYACPDEQVLQDYWQAAQEKAEGISPVHYEMLLLEAKGIIDLTKLSIKAIQALGSAATKDAIAETIAATQANATRNVFATGADEAVFWSGKTNGVGGVDVACNIASGCGGTTLEQLMQTRGITLPAWDASNPSVVAAWQNASKNFAIGASGDVKAVIGSALRPGSVWETIELPALKANPNITSITIIDPATSVKTVIFKR